MVQHDIDMSHGRLVFFEVEGRIRSGNIIDVDGVEPQVHDTLQANKKLQRFVPLYQNSKGDPVPREMPHKNFPPCTTMSCVNQSQVLATAPLEKVPGAQIFTIMSALQKGIVMPPIIVAHSTPAVHTESERTADITNAGSTMHPDMISGLDAIRMESSNDAPTNTQHYTHWHEAVVFPTTINSLSRRRSGTCAYCVALPER